MALTLTLPPEYGYVILTASLSVFVNEWHAFRMGSFRKAAKMPFPNAYATADEAKESKERYLFNCAQRAHANWGEHWPGLLVGLAAGGLKCEFLASLILVCSGDEFPLILGGGRLTLLHFYRSYC